jgi:hypothetical protein
MLLGELLVQKNKGKLICNSPNDIISGNFDSEKVDQDGIFYYKDILHFFFESPKCDTYQKSYWWLLTKQEITLIPKVAGTPPTTSISQLHPVQTT